MKTITKNMIGIFLLFLFYILLASCNGGVDKKLKEIQQQLDTIERKMEIDQHTTRAIETANFQSFVRLCSLYGLISDINEIEDTDELIEEIVDQNESLSDTVTEQELFLRVFSENADTLFVVAEHPSQRFNTIRIKYGIVKDAVLRIEILPWDSEDHIKLENTISQSMSPNVRITESNIEIGNFVIPKIQRVRYYEQSCHIGDWEKQTNIEILSSLQVKSK